MRRLLLFVTVVAACREPPSEPGAVSTSKKSTPASLTIVGLADVAGAYEEVGQLSGLEGGVARRRAALAALAGSQRTKRIVLDAGDHFFREVEPSTRHRSEDLAAAELLADSLRDFDAVMNVGVRDLAYGLPALRRLASRAGATLLSANLEHAKSGTAAFARSTIIERPGERIGVIGLSLADARSRAIEGAGLVVGSATVALTRAIEGLKGRPPARTIALVNGPLEVVREVFSRHGGGIDLVLASGPGGPFEGRLGEHGPWLIALPERGRALMVARTGPAGLTIERRDLDSAQPKDAQMLAGVRALGEGDRSRSDRIEYVGSKACRPCHEKAFAQWRSTTHARAWERLTSTRQSNNIDCIVCHATGFDRVGGPRRTVGLLPFIQVGCESCHGPGRAHARAPERVGLSAAVGELVCRECHRSQGDQRAFDFEADRAKVLGPGHGS